MKLAVLLVAAGLALVAAACGGGSPATARQSGALAFSRCMRSHGASAYPDPGGGGLLPKKTLQELGVGAAAFRAAQGAYMPDADRRGHLDMGPGTAVDVNGPAFRACTSRLTP